MMISRAISTVRFVAVLAVCVGASACAAKKDVVATKAPETTAAPMPAAQSKTEGLNVDDDIMKACAITEKAADVTGAPKFDFDSSDLTTGERDVLAQVAKCLTQGALKGRSVQLVGRADPRGETEYNMGLGGRRAHTVHSYLGGLGVDSQKLSTTSRGELDATGNDEDSWRRDRRVDIRLVK